MYRFLTNRYVVNTNIVSVAKSCKTVVQLANRNRCTLPLTWYRRRDGEGEAAYLETSSGDAGAHGMLGRQMAGQRLEQSLVVESVDRDVKSCHHTNRLSAELRAAHVIDVDSAKETLRGRHDLEQSAYTRTCRQCLVILFRFMSM